MSNDGTIDTGDTSDDNDMTGAGVARRLKKVERILTKTNNRLDRINAAMGGPPDDSHPEILASLASIVTLGNQALATADAIKVTVETGGTGIPGGGPG